MFPLQAITQKKGLDPAIGRTQQRANDQELALATLDSRRKLVLVLGEQRERLLEPSPRERDPRKSLDFEYYVEVDVLRIADAPMATHPASSHWCRS